MENMPFRKLLEYYHTGMESESEEYERPDIVRRAKDKLMLLLREFNAIKQGK
jgi:hypothetical protein